MNISEVLKRFTNESSKKHVEFDFLEFSNYDPYRSNLGDQLSLTCPGQKVEIDIGVNKEPVWYQQPWAWVIGAAIFILLLVALLRGGKKK